MKHQEVKRNFVTLEEIEDAEGASRELVADAIIRNREKQFFNNSMGYYRRYLMCDIPVYNFNVCKA